MRQAIVVAFVAGMIGLGMGSLAEAQIQGIGVLVGPTVSSFRGNNSDAFNSRTGFAAGGFVDLELNGMIGLRPEFLYVQKGATRNITPSTTFKIEYFEVPVLFTVDVPMEGALGVQFYAGPQVSILSKCRADTQGGATGVPCATEGLPVKSTDWGLIFGAELAIKMFLINVRYDMGISQIVDNPNLNLKNQAIMVLGGFLFQFPGMGS
ncbi:MAG: porin family protein [Gemmatimonadetes bacterium]|nr:porin family protein [Gemmatimonadota bacterium]